MVKCEGTKVEIVGNVIDVMAEATLLCDNMSRILKKETNEQLLKVFKDGLVKACDGYFYKEARKCDDDKIREAVNRIWEELKTMREEK